jgi:hypothetical protein
VQVESVDGLSDIWVGEVPAEIDMGSHNVDSSLYLKRFGVLRAGKEPGMNCGEAVLSVGELSMLLIKTALGWKSGPPRHFRLALNVANQSQLDVLRFQLQTTCIADLLLAKVGITFGGMH